MPRQSKGKGKGKGEKKMSILALAREAGEKALKKPRKDWKVTLDYNQLKEPMPHLPTGSTIIDYLIGGEPNKFGVPPCPGLPRSRISQVWGHESAGKTTLALTAAATTIANGGTVLYVDWENDIVPDYAAALGIPIDNDDVFELVQPETLEDGIKLATVYATAGVDLIVFDSVGAPTLERQASRKLEELTDQGKVGELQNTWSVQLSNLKRVINSSGTHIMGISQIRAKINTGGNNKGPTTQPQGGNAWKFYSSIRLELRRVKMETRELHNVLTHRKDKRVIGGVIVCKMIKCKLSKSQGREELFYIRWGEGIDDKRSMLEIGMAHGVVKKSGNWILWEDAQGKDHQLNGVNMALEYLDKNPEEFEKLYKKVVPYLGTTQFGEQELEAIDNVDEILASDAEEMADGPDLSEPDLDGAGFEDAD